MSILVQLRALVNTLRWTNLKGIYENGVPGVRWTGRKAGEEARRRRRERRGGRS